MGRGAATGAAADDGTRSSGSTAGNAGIRTAGDGEDGDAPSDRDAGGEARASSGDADGGAAPSTDGDAHSGDEARTADGDDDGAGGGSGGDDGSGGGGSRDDGSGGDGSGDDGSGGDADSAAPGSDGPADDRRRLSTVSTAILGLFLLTDVVFVCGALVTLWPAVLATVEPGAEPTATARWSPFGLGDWSLTADTAMLLAVVVCSALGSFVHAATSFATYVGNRRLYASWLWWYLLRAGIGVALALLVYLLLRGGLFAGSSGAGATNPYGFSGIAGLCGLFSKQATDKLREICDTLLSTTGDGDRDRRDGLSTSHNGDPGPS
ncbi:hypothetical protein E4N62_08605 [Streptomyces sp. MNU76]|uniref:hypothetical protein n=1 Tax=Streptomyces sp. MNU76 TaxID=2560026 RepID=UPI001E3A876D|nr:hypothetical protein [Streptomyces sp. MNU76]MCC9705312.1 hypothetical protein [Streptomyces sp. MNU76]